MPSAPSRWFRGSLSWRLAILFCLTFTLGITSAFLITYFEISQSLKNSSREVLTAKHREASVLILKEGISGLRDFLTSDKNRTINAPFLFRVLDAKGETLYLKPSVQEEIFDFNEAFKPERDPEKLQEWRSLPAINDEDMFDMLTEKVGDAYYLQIGRSSEDREAVLGQILTVFVIVGGLFVLASGGLGLWYARRALAPIRTLITTIARIETGDLGQRVALGPSRDELRDLGETFNRMIARIEKLIQVMRESLDNVAHDIRTPLTRIRAVAEDALISVKPASLAEALEDCAETATGISEMVDQLMSISEADAGTLALRFEVCDLGDLLRDVVEIYEFVALEKGIQIEIEVSPSARTWTLDRKRIKQVVANLIDNALKFSPAQTKIFLKAEGSGASLQISVKDQGVGIPAADRERIWERLYRGDKSRTAKGAGLGLAIVRAIVTAHGGHVEVHSEPGQGATFVVSLPLA
jgi:signal transduction histidine kinase